MNFSDKNTEIDQVRKTALEHGPFVILELFNSEELRSNTENKKDIILAYPSISIIF